MKWIGTAAAALLAISPAVLTAQNPSATDKTAMITLRGCVVPGVDKDTYVMTQVTELATGGGSTMPAYAHGRRVIFWLDDDADVKRHMNEMVEVRASMGEIEESEIELQAGPHKDGGLVVEFEGPGKDVRASNDAVGGAVGTAGRVAPEANDVKTFLVRLDVQEVKAIEGRCG